jgi:phosphoribosylformylglycinamidine cyclo-ligase
MQKLLRKFKGGRGRGPVLKAAAHITGGGFIDNLPRVLPKNCDVVIQKQSWDSLPIFRMIGDAGEVPETEMYQVFNMGIGMALLVGAERAGEVLKFIRAQRTKAWSIGKVVRGRRKVQLA